MALSCRDIIKSALRKLGDLPDDEDPPASEFDSAVVSFNSMLKAMHGVMIGPRLSPQQMSGSMQAENGGFYQASLSGVATLLSPKKPKSGQRFGVIDVGGNFSTNILSVSHGAQLLEGAAVDQTLNTDGVLRVWFFDADTGNWIREQDVANVNQPPPYPDRLNSYLPYMFAAFLAAEYGNDIRPDVVTLAVEGRGAFARNYARRGRNQVDAPFGIGQR